MTKKRKRVTMSVTVTVPHWMSAADARREVRELVTHQRNWSVDLGDVKAVRVVPAPRV